MKNRKGRSYMYLELLYFDNRINEAFTNAL
jgi:hypothetical protein